MSSGVDSDIVDSDILEALKSEGIIVESRCVNYCFEALHIFLLKCFGYKALY